MALGDTIKSLDLGFSNTRPSRNTLGGQTIDIDNAIREATSVLGSLPQAPQKRERDNAVEFSIDQAQKLGYKGIETLGGLVGSDTIKEFGRTGAVEQEQDIKEGGYQPQYHGSFRDQKGFGNSFGWIVEKSLENIAPTGFALAGAGAAALTAAFSVPAATVIGGATAVGAGLLGAGEVLSEQEEKGVEPDYPVAAGVGALIGLLDRFGAGKVIPIDRLVKSTTGDVVDDLLKAGKTEAAKAFAKEVTKKVGAEALTEATQEGLAVGSTSLLGAKYEPNEIIDRFIDAAILGGAIATGPAVADTAYGKFSEASKDVPAPETSGKPGEPRAGVEVDEFGQLRLFTNEQLPSHAKLDKKGKTVVVNPISGAPLQNKKTEKLVQFLANQEALKISRPDKAKDINKNIRKAISGLDKVGTDIKGGAADPVLIQETHDIINYYKDKLKGETKAEKAAPTQQELDFTKPVKAREIAKAVEPKIGKKQGFTEWLQENGLTFEEWSSLSDNQKEQSYNRYKSSQAGLFDPTPVTPMVAPDRTKMIEEAAKRVQQEKEAAAPVQRNVHPTVETPDVSDMGDFLNQAGDPDLISATQPPVQLNFTEWLQERGINGYGEYTSLPIEEQSAVQNEWVRYKAETGQEIRPEAPGMRDIETVTNIPAPKKKAAPKPKEEIEVFDIVEALPEDAIVTARGGLYKSAKIAKANLTRKDLNDTHKVVDVNGGGFAIVPISRQEVEQKIEELKEEDTRQSLEVGDNITDEDVAKLFKRWESLLEIKGKAEYVKNIDNQIDKFIEADLDWNSDVGKLLYGKVKDTIEGKASKQTKETVEEVPVEEDILAAPDVPVEATEGFTGLGAALQKAQNRRTALPPDIEKPILDQEQEVKIEVKAEEQVGDQIVFEEDEDVARLEKEAEKLSKEGKEKANVIIDTEAMDLKKDNVRIDEEIKDLKEEGYVEQDEEVQALRIQRKENVARLKELGAIRPVTGRKSTGADVTEEGDVSDINFSLFNGGFDYVDLTDAQYADLKKSFDRIKGRLKIDVPLIWVDRHEDLPKKVFQRIKDLRKRSKKSNPRALHVEYTDDNRREIYIIGKRQKNKAELAKAILHEIVGHYGIHSIFPGKDWDTFMTKSLKNTPDLFQRAVDRMIGEKNSYGFDFRGKQNGETISVILNGKKQEVSKSEAVRLLDEYIATMAEDLNNPYLEKRYSAKDKGLMRRLVAWIKHKLRSLGIGTARGEYPLTDKDIYGLLTEIHSQTFEKSPYSSVRDLQQKYAEKTGVPSALQIMSDTYNNPYYVDRNGEITLTPSIAESVSRTTRIGNQLLRMKKNIISIDTINQIKRQKGIRQQDINLVNDVLDSMGNPTKIDKNEFLLNLQRRLFPLSYNETDTYADWGVDTLRYEGFDPTLLTHMDREYHDEEFWDRLQTFAQSNQVTAQDILNQALPPGVWEGHEDTFDAINSLAGDVFNNDIDSTEFIVRLKPLWNKYIQEYANRENEQLTFYNNKTQLYSTPFNLPESGHFRGESDNYAGHTRTLDRGDGRYLLEVQSDTAQSLDKNEKPLTDEEKYTLERQISNLNNFIKDVEKFEQLVPRIFHGDHIAKKQAKEISKNIDGYNLGYYSPGNASFNDVNDGYVMLFNHVTFIKEKAQDDLSKKSVRLESDKIGGKWNEQFQPYIFERLINENIALAIEDGKNSYYVPTHDTARHIEGWDSIVSPDDYVRFQLTEEEKKLLQEVVSYVGDKELTGDIFISRNKHRPPKLGYRSYYTFGQDGKGNPRIGEIYDVTSISRGRRVHSYFDFDKYTKKINSITDDTEFLKQQKLTSGLLKLMAKSSYRDITKPGNKYLDSWWNNQKPALSKFNKYVSKNPTEVFPLSVGNFGIWDRYRTDIANFVKEQWKAEPFIDEKGNTWYKVDLTKINEPIISFQMAAPINNREAVVDALRQGTNIQDVNAVTDLMGGNFGRVNRQWFGKRYGELLQAFRKRFPKLGATLDPSGSLPFSGAKRYLHNISLGEKEISDTLARDVHKILKKYKNAEVNQNIISYFSTPDAETDIMLGVAENDKEELRIFKDAIVALGERLVNLGVLSQETFDANKGAYLPGRYMKHLEQYKGSGTKLSPMFYLRQTKDLTDQEKIELGRIVDADFLIPELIATIGRDVSLMQYFKNLNDLSNDQELGWVLGGDNIEINGRNYTVFELEQQIEQWDKQINTDDSTLPFNMSPDQLQELIDTRNEAQTILRERQISIRDNIRRVVSEADADFRTPEDVPEKIIDSFLNQRYKKVPKQRAYGQLAGQYIRTELYDEIVDSAAVAYNLDDMDGLSRYLAPHSGLDKAHQIWKASKILWNPPSWARNFFGNGVLLDISTPTNFVKLGHMLAQEMMSAKNGEPSKYWNAAHKMGLFGTTFSANELYLLNTKWEKANQRRLEQSLNTISNVKKGFWAMQEALYTVSELLSRGYGGMEGIFKTVALRDFIQRWEKENNTSLDALGRNEKETILARAADYANAAIFDYSDIPAWLRTMRRAPLGAPFLTFTYKSLPAIMRGVANQPQKFVKYLALPYILMYMATAFGDLDDNDLEEFQKKAPRWMQEKSGVYVLPVKDEHGRLQAMDFGYMFPWTPFMDIWKSTNVNWKGDEPIISTLGAAGSTLKSLGVLGGPMPSMITGMFANQENFMGTQIVPDGATSEEKIMKSSAWLYDLWMPSFFGSKGVTGKMMDRMGLMPDSLSRQKDVWGQPRTTLAQDTARIGGMNIYSVNPDLSNIQNIKNFKFEADAIRQQRSKTMRNHNLDTQTKIKRLKEYNSKLQRLNERRQKYFKEGF